MHPRQILSGVFTLWSMLCFSQIIVRDLDFSKGAVKPAWIIGVGWDAVDDNSYAFKKIFDIRKSWNIRPYPACIWVDKRKNLVSYGAVFNFNKYKSGKIINGTEIAGSFLFFSLDANVKLYMNSVIRKLGRFDMYITTGAGGTLRFAPPNRITATFNIGGGMNLWFNDWIGMNMQSLAKFGLKSPLFKTSANYLQHQIGVVLRFEKGKRIKSFIKPRYKWVHRKREGMERIKKF